MTLTAQHLECLTASTDPDKAAMATELIAARARLVTIEHDANAAIARLQRELNERPVL